MGVGWALHHTGGFIRQTLTPNSRNRGQGTLVSTLPRYTWCLFLNTLHERKKKCKERNQQETIKYERAKGPNRCSLAKRIDPRVCEALVLVITLEI